MPATTSCARWRLSGASTAHCPRIARSSSPPASRMGRGRAPALCAGADSMHACCSERSLRGQGERWLSMAFCCKAARSSRPSRRQAEPDAAVAREPSLDEGKLSWNPRQNAGDAVDRHALLNPHRSEDSCGIGINFRITETGDLEIESLAPAGTDASVPTPRDRAALPSRAVVSSPWCTCMQVRQTGRASSGPTTS